MAMLRTLFALCIVDRAIGDGKYVGIAKWRGTHGGAVGLCTAELIAKEWILTAEHCATRILKGETVKVQVEFAQSSKNVKRGVTHCVSAKAKYDVDVALCKLKVPVNAFEPLLLNSDHYKTAGPHGKAVDVVGTSGGYHAVRHKVLEYEGNGAHLYVNNAGGSGMKAGDSGGAWVHTVTIDNKTELVLSGIVHGGSGKRGVAGQVSHIRDWIDRITKNTTTWVSANRGAMGTAVESAPAPAPLKDRRNVLFIVADDLRPEMGCTGGQAVTPSLDAFAASPGAVVFDRAYVQQAICNPTRASFLTSRRPDSTRVWDLKTQFRESMPGGANVRTLPQYFREQGYWTAGLGKIFHPLAWQGQKDDIAAGYWSADYYQPQHGLPTNMTQCWIENDADEAAFADNMIAAQGVVALRQAAEKQPFFVAVGLHKPHVPWDVPRKYFDLYPEDVGLADHNTPPKDYNITGAQPWSWDPHSDNRHCSPLKEQSPDLPEYALVEDATAKKFRRAYFAAVSQTDANAGVVLAELDRLGLAQNTVVIFLGDHGWQLGDLGEFGKKTNFERATRSPLIIRDPKANAAAAHSSALVEFVDIAPTLVELAGLPTVPLCDEESPSDWCTEGGSLQPVLADPVGTSEWREAAFMQYAACMHDEAAFTSEVWHDACADPDEPRVMGYAMRTRRWRYIEWVRFDKAAAAPIWSEVLGTELYDHTVADSVENAAEAANVVADPSLAETVTALSLQLRAGWRARLIPKAIGALQAIAV